MESPIPVARYTIKYSNSYAAECAKLRSDESRRGQPSVAEAVKKFGGSQEAPKKPSPTIRRSSKVSEPADKAATQKSSPRSTTKRKDSSSEKKEDKKVSSPPKPPRNRAPVDESDNQPDMNGSGGNALDAIKMWENKTAGIVDSNPPSKKPLSVQKSSPVISSSKVEEEERSAKESSVEKEEVNGTEDTPVVEDKENKEKDADDGVSMRQSHSVGNVSRNFKSMSVVEPGTKPVSSTGKRGFTPAAIEKCFACKKTVYTVERLKADDKVYHKNCFKCSYCKKVVGTGTYAANKGEIFCKTHFKMLFKIKGNYDEGFGREQHKKKWGSGAQGAEQAAE